MTLVSKEELVSRVGNGESLRGIAREFGVSLATIRYYRKRYGLPPLQTRMSLEERFWSKVEKTATCWLWVGACSSDGYGVFRHGRMVRAHRFAYQSMRGSIPDGLVIDHLCRVRQCVNPDHMEVVTCGENNRRGLHGALKTSCAKGHDFTPANTKYNRHGHRFCYACRLARERSKRGATQ